MGGFLGGLGQLLGGWNAARRIDDDGFDFREQDAAKQFERDRRTQVAGQQDEDRAVGQIADVLASQEGEPDTSSIPQEVLGAQKNWRVQQALGKLPERKSSIEAAKASARFNQDQLRGDQRLAEIRARGDEAAEHAELQSRLKAGQPVSPTDQRRFELLDQAIKQRGVGGGRIQGTLVPIKDDVGTIKGFYNNKTGEFTPAGEGIEGRRTTPLGVTAQEQLALGTQGAGSIETIKKLLREKPPGETWTGPTSSTEYKLRSGQGPKPVSIAAELLGVEPPSGKRAIFQSSVGNLKNTAIKYVTGAQMSEKEVPRLLQEIPNEDDREDVFLAKLAVTEARLNLLDQVRRGQITREQAIQQINSMGPEQYFEQYKSEGLTTGPTQAPSSGSRYQKTRRQ